MMPVKFKASRIVLLEYRIGSGSFFSEIESLASVLKISALFTSLVYNVYIIIYHYKLHPLDIG